MLNLFAKIDLFYKRAKNIFAETTFNVEQLPLKDLDSLTTILNQLGLYQEEFNLNKLLNYFKQNTMFSIRDLQALQNSVHKAKQSIKDSDSSFKTSYLTIINNIMEMLRKIEQKPLYTHTEEVREVKQYEYIDPIWQQYLNFIYPELNLAQDSKLGPKTRAALNRFRDEHHLPSDASLKAITDSIYNVMHGPKEEDLLFRK